MTAAEEEVGGAWIADRPAAGVLIELEQAATLAERDHIVDDLRLRLRLELVGQRVVAAHRGPRDPQQGGWLRGLRARGSPAAGDLARPDKPSRCTLPITALRVMPPSAVAI